jgi:uncharacterized alpha-E superfamily protein
MSTTMDWSTMTAPRAMLARVADSMYWMARYIERAEHVARLSLENMSILTDMGDLSPKLRHDLWRALLACLHLDATPAAADLLAQNDESLPHRVATYMTFDRANPNSLLSSITAARENARSIREQVSAEMWEHINSLYWSLVGDEAKAKFEDSPQELFRSIINASMLFQGLTDETLSHGQGWLFCELAKHLERVDVTCRIIGTKLDILREAEAYLETPVRNIHYMSVLRSCGSIEAYRRLHLGEMDPLRIATFLVLERNFPRSIRYGVAHAYECIGRLRGTTGHEGADMAQRTLGKLNTQLEYAEPHELEGQALTTYLHNIQESTAVAAEGIAKTYFLH